MELNYPEVKRMRRGGWGWAVKKRKETKKDILWVSQANLLAFSIPDDQ
jgi:hypothetical protein